MTGELTANYESAIELFKTIPCWKDADQQIYICQKKIEEIKAKEEAERLERERQAEFARRESARIAKRNKKIALIMTAIVCSVTAVSFLLKTYIIPNSKYNKAIVCLDQGNVVEAYETLVALEGYKDSADKAKSIFDKYKIDKLKVANVGDYVIFGSYEQDNDTTNGNENIEWLVLEVEDDRMLVISKYALDCKQYNVLYVETTWETSNIRKWLNNNFINIAFSGDEKSIISTTTIPADKNPKYNTKPGSDTQDQVFLLSISEVQKYFDDQYSRECVPTEYAVENGADIREDNCKWWLRTVGRTKFSVLGVGFYGEVADNGIDITKSYSVRPAMWIDLSK